MTSRSFALTVALGIVGVMACPVSAKSFGVSEGPLLTSRGVWGESVAGLQCRVTPENQRYPWNGELSVMVELRNTSGKPLMVADMEQSSGRGHLLGFNRPATGLISSIALPVRLNEVGPGEVFWMRDRRRLNHMHAERGIEVVYDTRWVHERNVTGEGAPWRGVVTCPKFHVEVISETSRKAALKEIGGSRDMVGEFIWAAAMGSLFAINYWWIGALLLLSCLALWGILEFVVTMKRARTIGLAVFLAVLLCYFVTCLWIGWHIPPG